MTRETFVRDARRLRTYCSSKSVIYAGMLDAMLSAVEFGSPPWFDRFSRAWGDRACLAYYEAPSILLHRLHFWALRGAAPSLRPWLPSCGGRWGDGGASEALKFVERAPDEFWSEVSSSRLQTNEVARSLGWLLAASVAFSTRSTPFHLVDMGTSAGLGMIGDYLPRAWTLRLPGGLPASAPPRWDAIPYPVLSRTGLDLAPVDVGDAGQRAWLKACLGPDNPEAHSRYDQAADLFLRLREEPAGPKLLKCSFPDMPLLAAQGLRPHPEEGLLMYNAQAADFLSDEDYGRLKASVAKALAPWGDRGFWAELEMPRDRASEFHQLRVHRLVDGTLVSKVLAELTSRPLEAVVLPGWDFLQPLGPVRPPRITREEPPKSLAPGRYAFPKDSAGA